MVKNIAEGLASLAPGEAAVLRATGTELEGRLNKLGEEVAKLGKSGSGVDFILQHDALSWFFHDAGLSVMGVLQEEADEPPSAAALGALVKKMKAGKKRCIVVTEPQFPERVARSLARDAGAGLISLDPLASGPANPPAGYYEKVMAANVAALTKIIRHLKQSAAGVRSGPASRGVSVSFRECLFLEPSAAFTGPAAHEFGGGQAGGEVLQQGAAEHGCIGLG